MSKKRKMILCPSEMVLLKRGFWYVTCIDRGSIKDYYLSHLCKKASLAASDYWPPQLAKDNERCSYCGRKIPAEVCIAYLLLDDSK